MSEEAETEEMPTEVRKANLLFWIPLEWKVKYKEKVKASGKSGQSYLQELVKKDLGV